MVICLTLYILRHTNELWHYSLVTHNNESSLFAAWNMGLLLEAARLVVFRLVGCLRRNGFSGMLRWQRGCWTCEGLCSESPCIWVWMDISVRKTVVIKSWMLIEKYKNKRKCYVLEILQNDFLVSVVAKWTIFTDLTPITYLW